MHTLIDMKMTTILIGECECNFVRMPHVLGL